MSDQRHLTRAEIEALLEERASHNEILLQEYDKRRAAERASESMRSALKLAREYIDTAKEFELEACREEFLDEEEVLEQWSAPGVLEAIDTALAAVTLDDTTRLRDPSACEHGVWDVFPGQANELRCQFCNTPKPATTNGEMQCYIAARAATDSHFALLSREEQEGSFHEVLYQREHGTPSSADPNATCENDEHCYRHMHSYEHPCCDCGAPGVPVPDDVCATCSLEKTECECEDSDE